MKLLFKILVVFTLVLLLTAVAGVFYLGVTFRRMQNTQLQEIPISQEEEQEIEEVQISQNNVAFFHAVEFLIARAARNEAAQETYQRKPDEFFIEQGKSELDELFNDSGFIAYLNTMNLVLSQESHENINFIFFDFLTLEGKRIGSIGIQKRVGGIYLFDEEYVSLGAIQSFGLGSRGISANLRLDTDTLPLGPHEGGKHHTVLIAGTDQRMTDTLMLAIINEDTQEIDLFSLPRDLFYNGRKVNEFFYHYGPRRLVEEMENMTGFSIDNYIIIDMYAFIDVINILGGIEITLNAPLVDPNYRVRDNGQWSTLFYAAGSHHLNGIEALRVARSRNMVSDFGRARHQQQILKAIIDKITSMGVSDIGRVAELAMVFLQYVETDYPPATLIRNVYRYRSAKVRSQTVFDTNNILYHTYANLWLMGLSQDEADEDFDMGQYILLPLNDDWYLIHRFIRLVIEDNIQDEDEPS